MSEVLVELARGTHHVFFVHAALMAKKVAVVSHCQVEPFLGT